MKLDLYYSAFFSSKSVINMVFHAFFGILAPAIDPFFHALHLVLYINISDSAMDMLRASISKGEALVSTLLLAVFIIFGFSILNANYYSDMFDLGNIDVCQNLASCFFYSLNLGLRGSLTDSMLPYEYENPKYGMKIVVDILLYFLLNTIISNLIFGVILDNFTEMRLEANERSDKLKNMCLICQNSRSSIEEVGIDFREHTRSDHDFWLYLEFIKYLREKDLIEMTADEDYIYYDLKEENLDWVPLQKTVYLKNSRETDTDLLEKIDRHLESIHLDRQL